MRLKRFTFGDWQVDADSCTIRHGEEAAPVQLKPRAMDVLAALCTEAGKILSADDLLHLCWDGITVGENQVHKAIAQLRRALDDIGATPRYIENIRKRGYRTVAAVSLPSGDLSGPLAEAWSRRSPYVGLHSFDAGHAPVFFGRDAAITRLKEALFVQIGLGRAFMLLLGPSGSGKSSLVQAGLLPALAKGAPCRIISSVTLDLGDAGPVPLPTLLGSALLDLDQEGEPLFAGMSAEGIGALLTEDESAFCMEGQPDGKFLLFIDRLEALFAAVEPQRSLFLTALDRLARGGLVIVVAACRNDFYSELAQEPVLMEGKAAGGHFDLAPPNRNEISQMIRLPAELSGLSFGVDPDTHERLEDLLCEGAASGPDALPLLQYTLQQLYLQRSPGRELTIAAYRALGGVEGAIGGRAEAILAGLPSPSRAALPRIFSLVAAVGASDGTVRSLRAPWSALTMDGERALVRSLVEARLFVSQFLDRQAVFAPAHEALLRQWPRAVAWIAEHRQALSTRSRLEGLARLWIAEGRRADRLLRRGKPLEEARELAEGTLVPLNAEVRALIDASKRQARRSERLRLGALVGFALVAMAAAFLGIRARQAEAVAASRLEESEDLTDYMLGDLTEKLRPLGRLDLLDGVAQKALFYLTKREPGWVPGAARLREAKALQTLADVERSRGNVDGALKALTQAEALLQANLAEGRAGGELLKMAGTVSFWFGQIALDQGRIDEAERRFIQYRDFAERRMALVPDDPDAWVERSYALSSLGTLQLRKGEGEAAVGNFETSIALKRRALERHPEDRSLTAELADSLSWLANAETGLGHLDAAYGLFDQQRQALEVLQRLEPDAPLWSYRLAIANEFAGALLAARGRPDEALADLASAAGQIEDSLRREPGNRLWQTERIAIEQHIVRVYLTLGRISDAVVELQAARIDIDPALQANPSDDKLQRYSAQAHLLSAAALVRQARLAEADNDAGKAEGIAAASAQGRKKDKLQMVLLSNIALLRAEIDRNRGAPAAAKQMCLQAADDLRAVAQQSTDFHILDPWVRANLCGGKRGAALGSIAALEGMGYRDVDYLRFLTTERD